MIFLIINFALSLYKELEIMETILIQPKDASELKFILEMLERAKIKNKRISTDTKEDFLLGELMKTERTGKTVSRSTIMKKLKAK